MALPWVRLETNFHTNPKILALAHRKQWQAIACYLSGLAWSGGAGSDGYIPPEALQFIHGTNRIADQLQTIGLWVPSAGGGWLIRSWAEFQESSEETQDRRKRAQAAARKGNCVRWHEPGCDCWKEGDE